MHIVCFGKQTSFVGTLQHCIFCCLQASIVQDGGVALQSMCTCDGSHDTTSTAAGKAATGRTGLQVRQALLSHTSPPDAMMVRMLIKIAVDACDTMGDNVLSCWTHLRWTRQQGGVGTYCLACLLHYNLIVRKGHEDELLDGTLLMADHFTIERVFCNGTWIRQYIVNAQCHVTLLTAYQRWIAGRAAAKQGY